MRVDDRKHQHSLTCNSRVDYVDEELLQMMAKAGNWLISWGIESGNEQVLRHARKGVLTRIRGATGVDLGA